MNCKYLLLTLIAFTMLVSANAKSKWEIACQAYTFKEFTLEEALVKMSELGIKEVEIFSKQKMSPSDDRFTYFAMDADQVDALKAMLKKYGVKATSYGVISPDNEADWLKLFEFAQTMGIHTIVSEPQYDQISMVDKLAQKYKIRVAIHNHPKPTTYWNPDIALKNLEGKSKYMGVCADVGHWTRSGLDAAESLKKLSGRVFEIHMKDVTGTTKNDHAIVWGKGVIDWERVFGELKSQGFTGNLVIEHETSWENPVPDIKENLKFYSEYSK